MEKDVKGFIISGTVEGEDFPIMVMIPDGNPKECTFRLPGSALGEDVCLSLGELIAKVTGDASAELKALVRSAIRQAALFCGEWKEYDAARYFAQRLPPLLEEGK